MAEGTEGGGAGSGDLGDVSVAGQIFAGDFRITGVVHEGGLAELYSAERVATGERCVLKIVPARFAEERAIGARFLAEARAISALPPDHVPRILAWGEAPSPDPTDPRGVAYVAIEPTRGEALRTVVSAGGLGMEDAFPILDAIGHALVSAHDAGIVHRDLKPDSVLVEELGGISRPAVKVLFLGLAKVVSDVRRNTTAAMNRASWMAPEQAETDAKVTPATDVFTLGLLAFWALTGKSYWKAARDTGSAMMSLLREVLYDPIVPASVRARDLGVADRLPPGFDDWFGRCVARDPKRRFQHGRDAFLDFSRRFAALSRKKAIEKVGAQTTSAALGAGAAAGSSGAPRAPIMLDAYRPTDGEVLPMSFDHPAPAPAAPAGIEEDGIARALGVTLVGLGAEPRPTEAQVTNDDAAATSEASAPTELTGGPVEPPMNAPVPDPFAAPAPAIPPPPPPPPPAPAPRTSRAGLIVAGVVLALLAAVVAVLVFATSIGRIRRADSTESSRDEAERDDDDRGSRATPSASTTPPYPPIVKVDAWADTDCPVPVSSKDPTWGNRDAPVTIVVFSDFECPFCKKVTTTIETLKSEYGPEKLRVVWKNNPLPFHKNAEPTARAAMAVFTLGGRDAFWKFHDNAFENSRHLASAPLDSWATSAGVDATMFKSTQLEPKVAAKVQEDIELAKKIGVTGVPAFRVNGIELSGAQAADKFRTVIDAELAEAKSLVDAGTAKDKVYVTRTEKNFELPKKKPPEDDSIVHDVPLGDAPILGPKDALVTVVIFSDFQCPFCAKLTKTLADVRTRYPTQVRIAWKDHPLPFHKRAEPAALFAREVRVRKGDAGFWAMHDLLFTDTKSLEDSDFIGYAAKLGLSGTSVLTASTASKHTTALADDVALAKKLGATGTPTSFVNGRKLKGAKALSEFERVIDEEIPKAEALVAKGTPRDKLYEEIIKVGLAAHPAPPP